MELHFHPLSGCSRRVFAFVSVNAIPATPVVVNLMEGAHKRPEYLKLNPNGKVPTLVDGDLIVWESLAILRHLAAGHCPDLLGTTAKQRAEIDQWATWGVGQFGSALSALNAETGLKRMRGGVPDEAKVAELTTEAQRLLTLLGAELGADGFIVGGSPTVADFAIAPFIESCQGLSGLVVEDAAVQRWLGRMQALPGWPASPRVGR